MRIESGEGWKKAGMDVEHAAGPAVDEKRGQQAHIARQTHKLGIYSDAEEQGSREKIITPADN